MAGRVGGTTAVFGHDHRGLYFSKEVIPYVGRDFGPSEPTPVYHHVGVYAYRPEALAEYPTWDEGRLEALEGLGSCFGTRPPHPLRRGRGPGPRVLGTEQPPGRVEAGIDDAAHGHCLMPSAGPLPRTSIIVVSRHRPRHLARCLDALARQSHPDCEIVLVADPGSVDARRTCR